jgi:hypothetical protein
VTPPQSDYHAGLAETYRLCLAQISTKVGSFRIVDGKNAHASTGTLFVPKDFQTDDISIWLNANYTPSPPGSDSLTAGVDNVLSLYPDDPSAGSPFGTGNQTFGTGPGYKRASAIRTSSSSGLLGINFILTGRCRLVGDMLFQAQRRFWSRTIAAPSYAYMFTDLQLSTDPALGVYHSSELPYIFGVFGTVSTASPPNVANLSQVMRDYWISFAVSLTPNDGMGTSSAY